MVIVTTADLKRMIALNINVGFKKGVNYGFNKCRNDYTNKHRANRTWKTYTALAGTR